MRTVNIWYKRTNSSSESKSICDIVYIASDVAWRRLDLYTRRHIREISDGTLRGLEMESEEYNVLREKLRRYIPIVFRGTKVIVVPEEKWRKILDGGGGGSGGGDRQDFV